MRIPNLRLEEGYFSGSINISPTVVIDTSMEMFSRVLRRGKPEEVFFIGRRKSISACADITLALIISVLQL